MPKPKPGPEPARWVDPMVVEVASLQGAYPGADRLRHLVALRHLVEDAIAVDARTMNRRHATWEEVARVLGVSRQAAHKRYGQSDPPPPSRPPRRS